jgi:hypothetical protein
MKLTVFVPICCGLLSILLSFFAPDFYLRKTAINSVMPISDRELGNFMVLLAFCIAVAGIIAGFVLRKRYSKNLLIGVGIALSVIAFLFNLLGLPI